MKCIAPSVTLTDPGKTSTGTSVSWQMQSLPFATGKGHRHRAQVTCGNLLRHINLIICLARRCICYHSVPCICDELNDTSPSGRHLPEWVMNNHLEPCFVPQLVRAVLWLSVGVFAVGKKHSAWTGMSEAACMTTSSDHTKASLIEDWHFTILPCSNVETFQWVGVFYFIYCYCDKRQSDLQPFQSLMPYHEGSGRKI